MTESNSTIGVFVQARMSSQRLPGKVLREAAGKPLLTYLLERLDHRRQATPIVVLTSTDSTDDAIADYCLSQRRECFRGNLHNVAARFGEALDSYPFRAFVRLSADSPLLDPSLVDQAVELFCSGQYDLITNVMPRTYPAGQSVEVVRGDVFRRALPRMSEPEDTEHVTRFFYRNHQEFNICTCTSSETFNRVQLSVDTKADWDVFCRIIARFDRPPWQYGLAEVLAIHQQVTAKSAL